MRKGLFDRLEDIIKQTQEENKKDPNQKNASASVFDTLIKKAKDVLSEEDDEDTARRKIRKKVDEHQKENKDKEPKSVYDRVKELLVQDEENTASTSARRNKRNKRKKDPVKIPNIDLPYYNDLTDENKREFLKFREKKTNEIEDLIEKNKREEERLVERNKRELDRQLEFKTREEETLIERLLRKQEREERKSK